MEDEIPSGVWRIDGETRTALRMDRVRRSFEAGAWETVVLEAEELLDEETDNVEALSLLAEACLALGQPEVAEVAFTDVTRLDGADASAFTGLAACRFDLCEIQGAIEAAREAVRLAPDDAEAHHTLGLALERTANGVAEAVTHLAAARQLDPERFPFPLRLKPADWEKALEKALRQLSPELAAFWEGVPVRWEQLPDLEELRRHHPPFRPTVAGLRVGDPGEDDDVEVARPEAIRLFQGNLARSADKAAIVEDIAQILATEAMDWLGWDDEDEEPPGAQ